MQLGEVISGKYRLLRLLGDGGMGAVYEAHHEVLGARVAIKVLHEDLSKKPELVDRFLREARVLAQINNPHVVRVLDISIGAAGGEAGVAYIVMKLLTGEALSALVTREHRLPLPVAVDYTNQILEALSAAHALGVVHRDLKPENIFVTRDGERTLLKVIDFGIAKAGSLGGVSANLTVSGALMGTPEYMAPEQAHSADKADARSDVFAVGVMLYEMLSGARPVDGEDPRVVAMKVERGEIQPLIHRMPEIPRDLAGLIHRAMAARPELRFATANEMRSALESVMAKKRASSPSHPPAVAPELPPGTGTMFGEPAAELLGSARASVSGTDPGAGPPQQGYSASAPPPRSYEQPASQAYQAPPQQQAYASSMPQGYGPTPQPGRGRGRGGGGTVWLLVGLLVMIGGGVAVALAFTGSSAAHTPTPATPPSSVVAVATAPPPSATPGTDPTDPASDPSVGPLPTATVAPTTRSVTNPPRSSASGAPAIPSVPPSGMPQVSTPPFGIPPFAFPSSIPNPFPGSASSGVGPVLTIPTSFPNFGFPPDPAPSTPPSRPHHPGH